MTGFQVPYCKCGHASGDHLSGGPSLYAKSPGGRCMTPGCGCIRFRDADTTTSTEEAA